MGISQLEITSLHTWPRQLSSPSPQHQLFMEFLPHPASDYTLRLQAQHLHLPMQKAGPKLLCTVYWVLPQLNLNWIQSWHNLGTATVVAMLYPCLNEPQGSLFYWWYPLLTKKDKLNTINPLQDLLNTKTYNCRFILFHIQGSCTKTSLGWFPPEPLWTGNCGFSFCCSDLFKMLTFFYTDF